LFADLHHQIAELRAKGKDFNFAWFIERRRDIPKRKDEKKPQGLKDKYYWAVILALLSSQPSSCCAASSYCVDRIDTTPGVRRN